MSDLLVKIGDVSPEAAVQLQAYGFTDSDILSLTREDLRELLPGLQTLKLRTQILGIINSQRPVGGVLKELVQFIQNKLASGSQLGISDLDTWCDLGPSLPQVEQVKYQMLADGETFGAHQELMGQVQAYPKSVQFIASSQDSQILIVFCTIRSRIQSDVNAVLTKVGGNKPFILVLMHHAFKPTMAGSGPSNTGAALVVNVFFHETKPGLLQCEENRLAVYAIQSELLKHSSYGSKVSARVGESGR